MPDSIRIKEIHQALKAQTFATEADGVTEVVANLGYYIERIARVLGISVNPNGTPRIIRQKKMIEAGKPLPDGWNYGQWGLNRGGNTQGQTGGNSSEYRDGIIYEQRSNILDDDIFGKETIKLGNNVLCENFPQLIDEILDDLDKALDWQELGAGVIPNADGSGKYCTFEGLGQLLTEIAYNGSRVSQHTAQTQVASLICQAVLYELLKATGQPLASKSFQVDIGGNDIASVPYPALDSDAPSQLEQTGWLLETLAPVLGSLVKLKTDPEEIEESTDIVIPE